jgi:hypothetical protein
MDKIAWQENLLSDRNMTVHQIGPQGRILFVVSAFGFGIPSIGGFWAQSGRTIMTFACLVFSIPQSWMDT